MDLFTFWNIQKLKIIKYYLIQGIAYSNIANNVFNTKQKKIEIISGTKMASAVLVLSMQAKYLITDINETS